jgi:UDP-N-acetylmuramyl tripeptide synthase
MFMEIAIGAIGIGIVLMVGYLVIAQVRAALPAGATTYQQWNGSAFITVTDTNLTTALASTQATVFAGFGLLAVGIIVLAAFGLINVFK